MATVTGLTAERMLEIEASSVVDGDIVGDNLILTQHDGTQIDAGSVRGEPGPQGPVGQDLSVLSMIPIRDVGMINQIRAGRQLTAADFTNMGLGVPVGLWNLSDLTDASGNGRNLLNKGAVLFDTGINGLPNTAAKFSGVTSQGLYISDTGAADPFKIRTGSLGCWFRCAKRATTQPLISKTSTGATFAYELQINAGNGINAVVSNDGNGTYAPSSMSDVCDDRWHFAVMTFEATSVCLYVDGMIEGLIPFGAPLYVSNGPFNIGSRAADSSVAGTQPSYARIDEAFATTDVLSEEQVRNLYCSKVPHTLASIPTRINLSVRRRRKGAPAVTADFPAQPVRLYNFSAGSLGDSGSNGVVLVNSGPLVTVPGVDGTRENACNFATTTNLYSTDAGLPSGLNPRSYGCWIKTFQSTLVPGIVGWGAGAASGAGAQLGLSSGSIFEQSGAASAIVGPFVADGTWHHVVAVEDNTAYDQQKIKLYVDGRLVAVSTVMNSIALGGANRFRIGAYPSATGDLFNGQIDGVFVYAGALTSSEVGVLYAKSLLALAPSPKNAGDHVEAMSATDLLCLFDTLDLASQIDLGVAA